MFCMMTCYFDESGDRKNKWTWVCGYAASVLQWERFEVDWKIFLAKYDVPYFHMKEYSHNKGPFSKWAPRRMAGVRASFASDAASIIRSHVQHGFVSLVSHEIFDEADRIYKFREVFSSPYAFAGRICVGLAIDWRRTNIKGPLDMEYVFEDGCPDKCGLIHSMMTLVPHLEAPSFKPSRDFSSSNKWPDGRIGIVQLQAADFLAYESGKILRDRIEKGRVARVRSSMKALTKGVPISQGFMTPDEIDRLCSLAGIERRISDNKH